MGFFDKKAENTGADAREAQVRTDAGKLPSNRDFTHCEGGHCPLKGNCVRHLCLANPNPMASTRGISVLGTIPVENGKCQFYWPLNQD